MRRNAADNAMTALDRLAEAGEVEEEDEHGEDENFAANAPSSIWHESKPVNALFASVNAGAHGVETELAKDLFDLFASIKPPLRCRIMTSHELGARERHHHNAMHGLFEVAPSPPNNRYALRSCPDCRAGYLPTKARAHTLQIGFARLWICVPVAQACGFTKDTRFASRPSPSRTNVCNFIVLTW